VKSPSGTVPLLEVDTDGTSIATVTDLRKCRAPVEYYGTLADAVNTIGSMAAVLYLTERTVVDADVTVPSNITLASPSPSTALLRLGFIRCLMVMETQYLEVELLLKSILNGGKRIQRQGQLI